MKRGTFMTIAAVAALVFGLAFILIPAQLMALYGVKLEAGGQWAGRYLGSAFLGIAAITWLARKATTREALRPVLLGGLVLPVTGLVVAVFHATSHTGNALVWLTVVIYALLTVGFGYFQLMKPQG